MSIAKLKRLLAVGAATASALAVSASLVAAQATSKTLSTNYTLVNLSASTATVSVNYYLENGSNWAASPASTSFTVPGNGGQAIIAQYFDATMASGRGSAVVASDQPLGAVVQILARNQTPTQGAYIGSSTTSNVYYVPLVLRQRNSTNSQIMVQNAGTSAVTVNIELIKSATSPGANYTRSGVNIPAGATFYYDLSTESAANVADAWFGSAVVRATSAGGQITVISNLFAGADQLQTFNAFPGSGLSNKWFVPLFTSRLTNALSTPVSVQNLSGATAAAGSIVMNCTRDPGSTGGNPTFSASNTAPVANNESWFFNPVVDTTLPTNWFGSCVVNTPGNSVVFVQMRQPNVTPSAAAYEGINGNGTNRTVLVPLVGKILPNGFATPVTIQNLTNSANTVNITYTPAQAYVAGGGSSTPITENNVVIPANGSLIRNFRLGTTLPGMPNGWYGTMRVTGSGAIDGFVQITTIGATTGDTLMAHGVFTQP